LASHLAWRNSLGVMGLETTTPAVISLGASGLSGSDVNSEDAETEPNGSSLEPMVLRSTATSPKGADSDPLEGV
jgi:hypothetical protein